MVHYLIAIADFVEDVGCALSPDRRLFEGRSLRSGRAMAESCRPIGEPHPAGGPHDDVSACLEVLDQHVQHPARHPMLDLEQRHRTMTLLSEAAVHDLEERLRCIRGMRHRHLHVAHDTEHMGGADFDAGKELPEVLADDVFEHGEAPDPFVARQCDKTRKQIGDFDAGKLGASLLFDDYREVLAAIRDERKRMTRIEGQWRQDGANMRR